MTDSSSIDISVANIWRSYRVFRAGKKPSRAILAFDYQLLDNILDLAAELQRGTYKHGSYSHMIVNDNKRRDIAVASVRDRVVHRLLYDYLVPIWDRTFIYDAWSCRPGKGLHGAINRAQLFMHRYKDCCLWRADIEKLFDSVDQAKMKHLMRRRIKDPTALWLLEETLDSYKSFAKGKGIPIGNLTSQILANIYLNEFDRFMSSQIRPYAYLRYGDDWLCFARRSSIGGMRQQAKQFLAEELYLNLHPATDFIRPVYKGVSYLGVDLWPAGKRLNKHAQIKIAQNLNLKNAASYKSLVKQHQSKKHIKRFDWKLQDVVKTRF